MHHSSKRARLWLGTMMVCIAILIALVPAAGAAPRR